jgi:electron transfer flavoprotein beta subunit
MKLDIDGETAKIEKEIEGGKQTIEAKLPLILGCQEPISEWKIPNMRGIMTARTKPLEVKEPSSIDNMSEVSNFSLPPEKSACKMIDPDKVEELVDLLRNEAKVL